MSGRAPAGGRGATSAPRAEGGERGFPGAAPCLLPGGGGAVGIPESQMNVWLENLTCALEHVSRFKKSFQFVGCL